MSLLVVGAQDGSLGAAVARNAAIEGRHVYTAGVGPDEQMKMDVRYAADIHRVLDEVQPQHVVCTVGLNLPAHHVAPTWLPNLSDSLQVNVLGVAHLLQAWLLRDLPTAGDQEQAQWGHFVVVSSNSAHLARTQSAPYCASKAALSMLVRCVARETARGDENGTRDRLVYAYEPGLIDTVGTMKVRERLGEKELHRMPGVGPDGMSKEWLAGVIVRNLLHGSAALNGLTMRIDGGEQ